MTRRKSDAPEGTPPVPEDAPPRTDSDAPPPANSDVPDGDDDED